VTTIACDVLVVGSTLGGIVAGAYAARAGLRVTLLEEDAHAKRPPVLREPFLLGASGLTGPLDLVLRELGAGPVERRTLARDQPALQVALAEAYVDLGGGRERTAAEVTACGLMARGEADRWVERLQNRGDTARSSLVPAGPPAVPRGPLWSRMPTRVRPLRLPLAGALGIPPPPRRAEPLVASLVEALSHQAGLDPRLAPALLLRGTLDQGIRGADATSGVLDLLRRRFIAFHGEIRGVPSLALFASRKEAGVEVGRERLLGRALLLSAPGALLQSAVPKGQSPPRWLRGASPAFPLPTRLVRADRKALSSGMGPRVIDAIEPGLIRWISRSPDPADDAVEWIVVRAPTLSAAPTDPPLGPLAPFGEGRLLSVEPGPPVWWDLGGSEVRIGGRGWKALRSRHPLVLSVGPDVAPSLGGEGELLTARAVGVWLAETLSAPRRSPRVGSVR
jgi:hypothetical protein